MMAAAEPGRSRLEWVFLEIVVALALAVAIVWWTIPKKTRRESEEKADGEKR
jgi:hypothetical protein